MRFATCRKYDAHVPKAHEPAINNRCYLFDSLVYSIHHNIGAGGTYVMYRLVVVYLANNGWFSKIVAIVVERVCRHPAATCEAFAAP